MIVVKVVESGGKCHEVVKVNQVRSGYLFLNRCKMLRNEDEKGSHPCFETAHHIRKLVKHNVYGDI